VRSFIRRALPGAASVSGPIAIHAHYNDGPDRRATVRFGTGDANHPEVVVKLNLFPLLAASPAAHQLVAECSPQLVPHVIGVEELAGGSLLLLATFEGTPIGSTSDLGPLLELARSLATIQIDCAEASMSATSLQRLELADFRTVFQRCVGNISDHIDFWKNDGGTLEKAMGSPADQVLERLNPIGSCLDRWVDMLDEAAIGHSIEHGDCHAGNSVQRSDGSVLVFDWENACRAHPFLSAEKLLTSARALDMGKSGGPWGYVRNTPSQDLVVNAYLGQFGAESQRLSRAFNAAACLAVIKEMAHEMEWARMCDWKGLNPEWTAQLINRLACHAQRAEI